MRTLIMITTLLLTISAGGARAVETGMNPQAMVYISIPFDGNSQQDDTTTFGFRLDGHAYSRFDRVSYMEQLNRPAVFDLRVESGAIEGIYLSGINYYQLYRLHRQNEEEDTDYEDQVSVTDSIRGILSDMTDVAPMGVWIGVGLGVGLLLGSSRSSTN